MKINVDCQNVEMLILLKFYIVGRFRALSDNDYTPMKKDEIRTFHIDKKIKKHCKLTATSDDPNVIEVKIKKQLDLLGKRANTISYTIDGMDYGYLYCQPGYLEDVNVKEKAGRCGISEMFTRLCMNEPIHQVKNKDNRAMNDEGLQEFAEHLEWTTTHCNNIFMLEMDAWPRVGAISYFRAALASGFTRMFIKVGPTSRPTFYPESGPCCVEELQKRYDSETGEMKKGDEEENVAGPDMEWYYCSPKKEEKKCCTVI